MADDWIPNDPTSKRFRLWSRANAGEVFPDPMTPLTASVGFLHNLEPGWRAAYLETRMFDEDSFDATIPHNPVGVFNGFCYINMSLARIFGVRLGVGAQMIDDAYFGDMPGIPSYESEARPDDVDPEASARGQEWLAEVAATTDLARFDADRAEVLQVVAARPDLATLDSRALLDRLRSFETLSRRLWHAHLYASTVSGLGIGGGAAVAAAIGRPELGLVLSSGLGDVDSAMATHDMWPLSRMVASSAHLTTLFDRLDGGRWPAIQADEHPDAVALTGAVAVFLDRWGFRGPNEWEFRSRTWGTDPEILMVSLDTMRRAPESSSPVTRAATQAADRDAAVATVREALAGDAGTAGTFEAQLNIAEQFSRARERARMTVALIIHEQRLTANELGERLVAGGVFARPELIYMLDIEELAAVVGGDGGSGGPAAQAADRERRYLELFDYVPPFVVDGDVPPLETWERRSRAKELEALAVGESLTGIAGAPGSASGVVRIVLSPSDPTALQPGEILVCPITDPAWTPLFLGAAGVVSEVGAPVSHAAIVSRELGIPAAVSVPKAISRLSDGMTVSVDGNTGVVTRTA
ncbi:MAG: PEP-utilizing enzyme [Acidimicrobiales bacterium]